MRTLNERDKKILEKLAPELEGATGPAPGHDFHFILLPVSHKLSESPEDFAARLNRLNDNELSYIVDLILKGDEDVRSLAEGDFEALVDLLGNRFGEEIKKKLADR